MKIIKISISLLLVLVLLSFLSIKLLSQAEPKTITTENADAMAHKMLASLNVEAFDSLNFISWTFPGNHHYFFNKRDNNVRVEWGEQSVLLDLNNIEAQAKDKNGKAIKGKKLTKLKNKAWGFWCNDSFWVFAPYKIFDQGVERSVVEMDNGEVGLMASYTSGGVTPGDKYMWLLDDNHRPTGWRMWTKILPVKGVYTSWEDWVELTGGAQLASKHANGKLKMSHSPILAGQNASDIGKVEDDFKFLK